MLNDYQGMHMNKGILLVSLLALGGCSTQAMDNWATVLEGVNRGINGPDGQAPSIQENYRKRQEAIDATLKPVPVAQPGSSEASSAGEYKTVIVNTPDGAVQVHCGTRNNVYYCW